MRVLTVLFGLLAALTISLAANAQGVERIAAIVNDEVISSHDLDARISLVLSSTGQPNSPENHNRIRSQVLRLLIDERLQLQEAKKLKINITQADLDDAFRILEKQNKVQPGRFEEFLRQQGVDRASLVAQLTAELAWQKVIGRKLAPTVQVSDDDVDATLSQLESSKGAVEWLLAEIFLPIDSPDQDQEVERNAARLVEQLRGGANFAAVARQFSRGSTAANGGDTGWVRQGTQPEAIERTLAAMAPNSISDPIKTLAGYYIVFLRDRRQLGGGDPEDTVVDLKQILLPLPRNAKAADVQTQTDLARQISETVQGCNDVERAAKELRSPQSGELGKLKLRDLPAAFRPIVAKLPVGKASDPLQTENGIHVLFVCARKDAVNELPTKEEIRQSLLNQRLELAIRRTLRDLRRDAVVEFR